jgi:hypothetical protein
VVADAPLSELLRKGERAADGVERHRRRLRELAADARRVRSAAWPSSGLIEETAAQIEQWAEAGTPSFDNMVEHHTPFAFPSMTLQSFVRGEKAALAFTETIDARGLLCWLFKEQLLEKVTAGLREAADYKNALSQQHREEAEAEISSDMLAIERAECAMIWHAEAEGQVIDFRADTSRQAVLGVRLVQAPYRAPDPGGHAFDIVDRR